MTIFQYTIDKVLDGTKDRTSRLKKPGERIVWAVGNVYPIHAILGASLRTKWEVGKDYAIQAGRGVKSEGRFKVLALGEYDARNITQDEAKHEGFEDKAYFLDIWCRMHDWRWYRTNILENVTFGIHSGMPTQPCWDRWYAWLADRPAKGYYAAWWIDFEVLK